MISSIWLALRPKTLTAAVVPIVVGTALAYVETKSYSIHVVVLTLLASLFIQIATNLFNDAIDFKKGADTDQRIGPQRVTQSGLLKIANVYLLAGFFLMAAVICGIPLVIRGGMPILGVGLVSLFLAYAYTGGPLPLAYKGLGDIFVVLFFGVIAIGGVYYLHTLQWHPSPFIAGLQIGFLATVLLAINNLRDIEQDRLANKKTLAVRFGIKWARYEIIFLLLAAFFLGSYWLFSGKPWAAILPLVVVPLTRKIILGISSQLPGPQFNVYLGQAALVHLVFGLQLSLGLILANF
ncbi:MAG: 1,4-dihydroxy-2-naphthoate octaprenyltransferase [Bdellovibrionales bacterium]|nr:1,4-dihydroxy-2-naphthoate octaprenyltransferase [Bdellovibrionales bacterium]